MDYDVALHLAIDTIDLENFYLLLDHPDVDLNCRNDEGKTPLIASIEQGPTGSIMAMSLIKACCDINYRDEFYRSPLHLAILYDLVDVAHALIQRGTDINTQAINGDTPLFSAVVCGNLEAVSLLLYYQADVNIATWSNKTPLMETFDLYMSEISEVLLDYYDDLSCKTTNGWTALHFAAYKESVLAVDLVKRGADVNCLTNLGDFPLYYSMWGNDAELFISIWSQVDYEILLSDDTPFLLRYVTECRFSTFEWVECLYLILKSSFASALLEHHRRYIQNDSNFTFLWYLLRAFERRDIELNDRMSLIYICLSLGAETKTDDLQNAYLLYGFNKEFEAFIYTTKLSYDNYIEQMALLFKNSLITNVPVNVYRIMLKHPLSTLGYFSMSQEKRQNFLNWIQTHISEHNVILDKLYKIPHIPSLLELSRDGAQKFIEQSYKITKPYQFHDVVKSLKLPQALRNVLLFKQPIY